MSATEYIEKLSLLCYHHPENVQIGWDAKQDAKRDFLLDSLNEIKEFIGNGGLEKPVHEKSVPLKVWKGGRLPIVHSYSFLSEGKKGYVAFYEVPNSDNFFIKSFKFHYEQNEIDLANIRKSKFRLGDRNMLER